MVDAVSSVASSEISWLDKVDGIVRKQQPTAEPTVTATVESTKTTVAPTATNTATSMSRPTGMQPTSTTPRAWETPVYPRPSATHTPTLSQSSTTTTTQATPTAQPGDVHTHSGSSLVSMWRSSEVFRIISAIIGITALSTIAALVAPSVM